MNETFFKLLPLLRDIPPGLYVPTKEAQLPGRGYFVSYHQDIVKFTLCMILPPSLKLKYKYFNKQQQLASNKDTCYDHYSNSQHLATDFLKNFKKNYVSVVELPIRAYSFEEDHTDPFAFVVNLSEGKLLTDFGSQCSIDTSNGMCIIECEKSMKRRDVVFDPEDWTAVVRNRNKPLRLQPESLVSLVLDREKNRPYDCRTVYVVTFKLMRDGEDIETVIEEVDHAVLKIYVDRDSWCDIAFFDLEFFFDADYYKDCYKD